MKTMPELLAASPRGGKQTPRGFTLIELLIAVAIVAILARVALPAYFDTMRKARRADAVSAMSQVQQAQERWRANNSTYSSNFGTAGLNIDTSGATVTTYTTSAGYYSLGLSGGTSAYVTTYNVLATAQGSQANDTKCKYLQMAMSGGNMTYASGPTSSVGNGTSDNNLCWRR